MDRPKKPHFKFRSLSALLFISLALGQFQPLPLFAQTAPAPSSEAASTDSQEQAIEENPFADLEEEQAPVPEAAAAVVKPSSTKKIDVFSGLFYGHIGYLSLDPKRLAMAIFPISEDQKRRDFVLDEKTEVYLDLKPTKLDELRVGQKVAVRYFSEERLAIAESIFVEHGDFRPDQYNQKKRRPRAKAK